MDHIKICRACLAEEEPMLSLFDLYEHELSLAVILQSCLAIEVHENDNLPPYLCDKCIQTLTQFYNFTIIYEQSDQHLRSLLPKELKYEPHTNPQEKHVTDQAEPVHNRRNFEYLEKMKLHSQDSNNIEDPDDNNGEVIPQLEDYDYDDVKDNQLNDQQDDVHYLTLETIKSENLDLEICGVYSSQDLEVKNLVQKEVPKPNKTNMYGKDVYEEVVKYECTLCGEEHLYLIAFRNHMRTKHSIFHVNPAEYSSIVHIEKAKSEPIVEELTQAHEHVLCSDPSFKCELCGKRFHFQAQLNKHAKLHKLGKKFICEVCGAGFIRKTYLDDHKEGHSTERKHTCPFCNKKFRRRTVLRAHKRSHTHRNYYVCELCGRAFTGKGTLRTHHLLIHVRERNFMCMICHQKFPLKSTLNKHVLRHVKRERGEKGFNCTECDMEYRDKSSLKRHVEVKHLGNVVLVSCPDCPKEYTSNANLQKHRKRHHPTEIIAL